MKEIRVVEGGQVTKVLVKAGDKVSIGDVLVIAEADKEAREYKSDVNGVIKEVNTKEGEFLKLGQLLVSIEETSSNYEVKIIEGAICQKVLVKVGDLVKKDDVLVTTEVDKETREYVAPGDGLVKEVNIKEGDVCKLDTIIVVIEPQTVDAKDTLRTEELRVVEGGKCLKVLVKAGDKVKKDTVIATSEADKETREYKSSISGIVKEVGVTEGEMLKLGQLIAIIEPAMEEEVIKEVRCIEGAQCTKVLVKPGDIVKKDDTVVIAEADKEAREYKSPITGVVKEINVKEGDLLKLGQMLVSIKEEDVEVETDNSHKELIIIGGGPGGYVAAIYAAKNGIKPTLIEKNQLGGTCLNVGCIPTKAMIQSAEVNNTIHNASLFGIEVDGTTKVNMPKVIERKNKVVNQLVSGVSSLMKSNQVEVIEGTASFKDDKTVIVNDMEFTFDNLIVASGSKISQINIPGIDLPFVLNSTTALDLKVLPEKMTIIGGGVIGLEFAFLYKELGVDVTVVEFLDRLLNVVDSDLSQEILKLGKEKGINFELSSKVTAFEEKDGKAITKFEKAGQEHTVESDYVLVAIGREPNMDDLAVENTTLVLNDRNRGIKVDEYMHTNVEHIYAIGDVNNLIQLAHAASHQGILVVDDILGKAHAFDKNEVPSVVFTSPEIATVGLNEDYLKQNNISYKVGRFDYIGNGKALTMNQTKGYVKLIKDENDVIIGGSIIGPDASSLIETINAAVVNKLKDEDIRKMTFAHPTTGEVIHEAAMDLGVGKLHL